MRRKTKIIATIGPSTIGASIFERLIGAGVDYIRINTAYGDYDQYDQILGYYRQYASAVDTKIIFDIKDLSKLDYFVKNKLDMVAASFVNYPEQLREIKEKSNNAYIISKIETVLGVQNIDSILAQTDGLMIARGDLSEAESIEKIPVLQKDLTRKAVASGKFLVTATEMLLSMINNPKPTIAEISDVSNAVFDGSDAVMLSEETATGKYPIEAVSYMRRAIEEAEKWMESEKI